MQWVILAYNLHIANVKKSTKKQKTSKNEKLESIFKEKDFNPRVNESWIQRPFVLAFYYLLESTRYEDLNQFYLNSIKEVIQEGGDTDTNASIVGAMIGALTGVLQLPEHMIDSIMSYNCLLSGRIRPELFSV